MSRPDNDPVSSQESPKPLDNRAFSAPNGEYIAGLAIGKLFHVQPIEDEGENPAVQTAEVEPDTHATVRHLSKIVRVFSRAS